MELFILVCHILRFPYRINYARWPMRRHSGIDILRLPANSHMRFTFVGLEIRVPPSDERYSTRNTQNNPLPPRPTLCILTTVQTTPNSILPGSATRMTRKHAEGRFLLETASCLLLIEPLCIADLTLLASPNRNYCFWPSYGSFTLKNIYILYERDDLFFHVSRSIIILKVS
jgi:hypothetical protein